MPMRRSLNKEDVQCNLSPHGKSTVLLEQYAPYCHNGTTMAFDNICEHKNKDVKPGSAPTVDGQTRNKEFATDGEKRNRAVWLKSRWGTLTFGYFVLFFAFCFKLKRAIVILITTKKKESNKKKTCASMCFCVLCVFLFLFVIASSRWSKSQWSKSGVALLFFLSFFICENVDLFCFYFFIFFFLMGTCAGNQSHDDVENDRGQNLEKRREKKRWNQKQKWWCVCVCVYMFLFFWVTNWFASSFFLHL